jgi:hypothetical protein
MFGAKLSEVCNDLIPEHYRYHNEADKLSLRLTSRTYLQRQYYNVNQITEFELNTFMYGALK